MNKIKKFIIIFAAVIIVIILILIALKKNENNNNLLNNDDYLEEGEEKTPDKDENGYIDVSDASVFYSVVDAVNKYVKIMQYDVNTQISDEDIYHYFSIKDEYLSDITSEDKRAEAVIDLLDEEYKKSNNVLINNYKNKLYEINENTLLVPIEMKAKYDNNISIYILKAYMSENNTDEKYFICRVDSKNQTFSIEFVNEKVESIDNLKVSENDNVIQPNSFNSFQIENMTYEQIAQKYFDNFKTMIINYTDVYYSKYFTDEYKEKRFGSINEFKVYIEKNKEKIKYLEMYKYLVNTTDDYVEYICQDQYGRNFVFRAKNVMNYTVQLDTYTIPTEKFKETYDKAEGEKKVQMNIDKFIQMVNRNDCKSSYNCIADGFKNNYLDTQDKFENYIKNEFFEYNNFEFDSIEQKGSNLYTCTLTLTDATGNSKDSKKITIIMQLNDNYDFKMSFSV